MKLVIDNLDTTTSWTASGGATIYGVNAISSYIAGDNDGSAIFKFNALNSYVEKTYATDVSDYDNFTIWIYSAGQRTSQYRKAGDFFYKIDLGTGKEFYLNTYENFYYVSIDISDIDTIDRIRITSNHAEMDYLICSYAVASADIFPLDILNGVKERLEDERDNYFSQNNIGTITASAGDNSITFSSNVSFIDRYVVIQIDDGANSEKHQIEKKESNTIYFSDQFDGSSVVNNFTDANVYLYYPVNVGTIQQEIRVPSISVWGFAPERVLIDSEQSNILDSIQDNTFKERKEGQYLDWLLLIDCESREGYQVLGELSLITRQMIGKKYLWVNGRKINIDFEGASTEIDLSDEFEIVPKIQYPARVQIREDLYERTSLPKTTVINTTVEIEEQS